MKKSQFIDHTLLLPQTTEEQVIQLCQEAKQHQFCSVCINPYWVKLTKKELYNSNIKVCTVIGFPLGATTSSVKAFEAKEAVQNGADEVDMVLNIGLAKKGNWQAVKEDIKAVVNAVEDGTIVKVILETCLLDDKEIIEACKATLQAGADFVKTSTGFSTAGATTHHIHLMRECVGKDFGVKASGGIRTAKDFDAMLSAGANRIGASAGICLLNENNLGGNNNVY